MKWRQYKTVSMFILRFWRTVFRRYPAIHQISVAGTSCSHCSYNNNENVAQLNIFKISTTNTKRQHIYLCMRHVCKSNQGQPTETHPFNGPFSGTTQVSRYQKGKTNLDFTEARDSEWQWHQLDHMQVCTSLQTNNHASTPPLSFLQAGCPSYRPTNSVKALKGFKAQKISTILLG